VVPPRGSIGTETKGQANTYGAGWVLAVEQPSAMVAARIQRRLVRSLIQEVIPQNRLGRRIISRCTAIESVRRCTLASESSRGRPVTLLFATIDSSAPEAGQGRNAAREAQIRRGCTDRRTGLCRARRGADTARRTPISGATVTATSEAGSTSSVSDANGQVTLSFTPVGEMLRIVVDKDANGAIGGPTVGSTSPDPITHGQVTKLSFNDRVITLPESRGTAGLVFAAALLLALRRRRCARC
jgi:hypothetical protein